MIELYEITVGSSVSRFTSSQDDVDWNEHTWLSQPVGRSASIEQTTDALKTETTFEVEAGTPIANLALNPPGDNAPTIRILRDEGDGYQYIFVGRIVAGTWNDGKVDVELRPLASILGITGLNEEVGSLCRYSLGSRKCGVPQNPSFVRVEAIDGQYLKLATPVQLVYQYGFIKLPTRHIGIDAQPTESTLLLLHRPYDVQVGQTIELYPGCDRTLEMCQTRYKNSPNFGGAANLPGKNPYLGDPINW